jgi:hypothetical protein
MIEYLAPSGGGSTLTYKIKQVSHNLTTANLKALNTKPFELIPASTSYYVPLQVSIYFRSNSVNTGQNYFIGYEPLLGASLTSYFCFFDTSFFATTGNFQFMGAGIVYRNTWTDNAINNSPLVLWQQTDDGSADFSNFQIIVTYIEYNI